MKKIHYFKSKKEQYVIISEGPKPVGTKIPVLNKKEANKIAKDNNYQKWNY